MGKQDPSAKKAAGNIAGKTPYCVVCGMELMLLDTVINDSEYLFGCPYCKKVFKIHTNFLGNILSIEIDETRTIDEFPLPKP